MQMIFHNATLSWAISDFVFLGGGGHFSKSKVRWKNVIQQIKNMCSFTAIVKFYKKYLVFTCFHNVSQKHLNGNTICPHFTFRLYSLPFFPPTLISFLNFFSRRLLILNLIFVEKKKIFLRRTFGSIQNSTSPGVNMLHLPPHVH